MTATCESCRFWLLAGNFRDADPIKGGFCRRRAPVSKRFAVDSGFPETFHTGWCGEHQPREVGAPVDDEKMNDGRGRNRPKHLRRMYLAGVERFPAAGTLVITMMVDAPTPYAFRFPAQDDTSAICKIELLRQGAWSIPLNEGVSG